MFADKRVVLIIPARNEAEALPGVLSSVPGCVDRVIVCDNGSTDGTGAVAAMAGALVVSEPQPGYGAACLRALRYLDEAPLHADLIVFADADGSDDLSEMPLLLQPLAQGRADLVIGSRIAKADPGALTPVQHFGNQFAGLLIGWIWGGRMRDLGPFRALPYATLRALNMADRDFGWTVEMQIKAARVKLRVLEVDVSYRRRRAGHSKIAGTLLGSLRAGSKILAVIAREALRRSR